MNLITAQSPSIEGIKEVVKYGNFHTAKNKFGETKLRNFLLTLYPKYTIKELESLIEIPDSTLARWFVSLGVSSRMRWHIKILSKAGNRDAEHIIKNKGALIKERTVQITPDLAYLIGFSLGDGSVQKYMVEFFNKDLGLYHYLLPRIKGYGSVTEEIRDNGLWRLRLSSVRIANLIKKNNKIDENTIAYIFKNKNLARKFVAAFWDAEGRVAPSKYKYFHIYLYNTNKYLLDLIGEFLKNLGIDFSVHSRLDSARQYVLRGRPVQARKILHRISIPKKSSQLWAKEIGLYMNHSKKQKAVSDILSR